MLVSELASSWTGFEFRVQGGLFGWHDVWLMRGDREECDVPKKTCYICTTAMILDQVNFVIDAIMTFTITAIIDLKMCKVPAPAFERRVRIVSSRSEV